MRPTNDVYFSLLFASIAMGLIVLLILLVPAPTTRLSFNDKVVVSASFIASCCVGISLALYPGLLRRKTSARNTTLGRSTRHPTRAYSGHHPDCDTFNGHRLTIGTKAWCAGCLGLLLGALISIVIMVIYMISPLGFSRRIYELLVFLGLALVVMIFLETSVKSSHPMTHLSFNVMLILDFFLISMSVTELTGKGLFGVLTVLLCAVWLSTRVTLSTWRHRRTCRSCTTSCKMYTDVPSVSKQVGAQR